MSTTTFHFDSSRLFAQNTFAVKIATGSQHPVMCIRSGHQQTEIPFLRNARQEQNTLNLRFQTDLPFENDGFHFTHRHAKKNKILNHSIDKVKKLICCRRVIHKQRVKATGLCDIS